jgi:pimeloyl-ACP methyl ester carboxylesterase
MAFAITAAGYVEKYGPDERYNYLRFLDKIDCPVLMTFGEKEVADHIAFRQAPEDVAQAAPAARVTVVSGADHFYTSVRADLFKRIESWLAESQG